jgi:spore photoproduct lyase
MAYQETASILKKFPNAEIIFMDNYQELFCRPGQDFQLQKNAQKLVLAVKKGVLVYPGPAVCQDFGNSRFYYASPVINCIYDCEYCFLQGMYPSGNIVVFVNLGDYFAEVKKLSKSDHIGLSVSYDTDLLALSGFLTYAVQWVRFAENNPRVQIEIRTKSMNYRPVSHLRPPDNLILAWTLSPEEIIRKYENGTPSLRERLNCIEEVIQDGWRVRLCFDPVFPIDGWKAIYEKFISRTFSLLKPGDIDSVSTGVFRMNTDYFKKIRKARPYSLFNDNSFTDHKGTTTYLEKEAAAALGHLRQYLAGYLPESKIFQLI